MQPPAREPIGLRLTRTSRDIGRAFDDALAAAGGSLPTWVVLVSLKGRAHSMQRDIAASAGIEGATLTHHLNRMEAAGLVVRTRDPENRRNQRVTLTDAGDALFFALVKVVAAFDTRLRTGIGVEELATFEDILERMRANTLPLAEQSPTGGTR